MVTEQQQLPQEDSVRFDGVASSRESLRKEVNLRRDTLTPQELGFLTGLMDSGSELEVSLAALKLSDTTLFYARSGDEDDEDNCFNVDNDDALALTLRNSDKELAVVPDFQAKQDSARRQESLRLRRQSQLHGQIWKAHQNGLAVSQKSSQRSFLQREKSWSSRRMTLVAGPGRIAGTSNIFNNSNGSATRRSSLLLRQSSSSRLLKTFQNSVPSYPTDTEKYVTQPGDSSNKLLPAFRRMNSGPAKLASSSYSRRRRVSLNYDKNNSDVALLRPKNVRRVTLAGSSRLPRTNASTHGGMNTPMIPMMTSLRRHQTVPNRRASTSCLMGIPEDEMQLQPQQSSELLVERPERNNINDGTVSLLQPSLEDSNDGTTGNEKNRERQRDISMWEGTILPEEQEDKKMSEEELFQSKCVQEREPSWQDRVEIRRASVNNYDGEGMEVAHVLYLVQDEEFMSESETFDDDYNIESHDDDEDDDNDEDQQKHLLREEEEEEEDHAIVMRRASVNVYNGEGMEIADWDALDEIEERKESLDVIYQRGASGHHHKTTSFDVTASFVTTTSKIPASHSFDETQSQDRTQSFPEVGKQACMIYRSLSEDELASFFTAQTSMRNKEKTNSDVTATTVSEDDDNDSYDSFEYDAWVDNPEVEGGILDVIPFRILGTSADDVDSHPHVLSPPLMESLQSFFPFAKTSDNFWMKYSLVRDGASMHTLLQHARGAQFSILALETVDGEVMGAFTTEPWRKTWSYFGGGDSFLWRMRHSRKTKCHSIIDQAHLESEIEVFPYTGENHCIQFCTSSKIAVGGGSPPDGQPSSARSLPNLPSGDFDSTTMSLPQEQCSKSTMNLPAGSAEPSSSRNSPDSNDDNKNSSSYRDHEWGYGISLEKDLLHGSSSPCVTFGSPPLSDIHSDGSLFEIINIELWTLTPCYSEEDAQKLELGRLFLEERSFYDQSLSTSSVGEMFG